MGFELNSDELILAVVSLARAINPRMLRQGPEGFEVDCEALYAKKELTPEEVLLLRLCAVMQRKGPSESRSGSKGQGSSTDELGPCLLTLAAAERRLLRETLEQLESLQSWPADVLELSRGLRARLALLD
jgi:hypothetical protein